MFYPLEEIKRWKSIVQKIEKEGFVWIGNFNHPPNKDALDFLGLIWPEIRRKLPAAELHIYGSFCPPGFSMPGEGIVIKGEAESVDILAMYKVMLAPIRFGAGIKGKITDAWMYGVLPVTTSIGAEGLIRGGQFPGRIADTQADFVESAVRAYTETVLETQNLAYDVLMSDFSFEKSRETLGKCLDEMKGEGLERLREGRMMQQLLWSQGLRAAEYFSRFLQLKEEMRGRS